jgi:glutathione peroxidase
MKTLALILSAFVVGLTALPAGAADLRSIPVKDIEGKDTSLKAYEGKVLLIVNVASACGYTRQYKPLQEIYTKYKDQGFEVLGFPSNDFGGQEPGSNEQIKQFCSSKYSVSFPMFDKVGVSPGEKQHLLYAALTSQENGFPGKVNWNFGKFLVDRKGKLIARFESKDEPDSEKVTKAIEAALKAK